MSTELILAGFLALVAVGGIGGFVWLRNHPDA
jgi:hypothetical protein